ncbi:MAG: hypothetical protein Q7R97_00220 [Candidatus Daviesbacteria bacterium]|nr:hypothetical protein [Candidatus Daviesbacteria bacterium]
MEWLILLAIIVGIIYWSRNSSGKNQDLQIENQITTLVEESDKAHDYVSRYLNKLINEDIPKWEKEDKERDESIKQQYKKNGEPLPKYLSKNPEGRKDQLREYTQALEDIKEMRNYVIKWGVKNRYATPKERLEIMYDWNTYIQTVANRYYYKGFEGIAPTNDAYEMESVLLKEIKNKYKQSG